MASDKTVKSPEANQNKIIKEGAIKMNKEIKPLIEFENEVENLYDKLYQIDEEAYEIKEEIKDKKQEYLEVSEIENLDEFLEKATNIKKEIKDLKLKLKEKGDEEAELWAKVDDMRPMLDAMKILSKPSPELIKAMAGYYDPDNTLHCGLEPEDVPDILESMVKTYLIVNEQKNMIKALYKELEIKNNTRDYYKNK